ncbi:MAG: Release factor glutamine methyltransferase [candidate division TM6 bacterium GW2011_GWF2_32_72]|nr:MAG: Release factor glutamine methyltransferase [candidate division TM6 bacterium GW2011_GWF2_32_72]
MKILELTKKIADKLSSVYDSEISQMYAWWILEEICEKKRAHLLAEKDFKLTESQEKKLKIWLEKLIQENMPLQYLIGYVNFCGVKILVRPPVLIPRPETEEIVLNLIEKLKPCKDKKLKVLDLCTGSGCIVIALSKAFPSFDFVATDISEAALYLAQENAELNELGNIEFVNSDVYENLPVDQRFDLIISNPPYIDPLVWDDLDLSVTEWEDEAALIAENHGLAIIERIVVGAKYYLQSGECFKGVPKIVLEIGFDQGPILKKLLESAGFVDVDIEKDLAGKDRSAVARL